MRRCRPRRARRLPASASCTVIPAAISATSSLLARAQDAATADRRTPRRARRGPASRACACAGTTMPSGRPSRRRARRLVRVAGWRTVLPWTARNAAMSSSAICEGPSSPIETPACEPHERSRAADRRHAHEVVRAARGTRRTSRRTAASRAPASPTAAATICCSAMYISKKRSGCAFAKISAKVELPPRRRERRRRVERAERRERVAVGLARRDLARRARSAGARADGARSRRGARTSGFATSTRMSRTPPSSAIARLGILERLAVPAVLVLDRRDALSLHACGRRSTVGLSGVAAPRRRRASIASRSCPSISIAFQPNASARAA